MLKKFFWLLTIIGVVLFGFWGWDKLFAPPEPIKQTQFLMDTIIEITAYGANAEAAENQAFAEVQRLHKIFDRFDKASETSQINANAGIKPVKVSKDVLVCVRRSAELSAKLDNAFDITIGPLTKLWGIGHKDDFVPAAGQIKTLLPLVDYHNIVIDEQNQTVFLTKSGMKLDFGGVAKGYACDRLVEVLKANGIKSALVNAGGDVRVIGNRSDGKPWRIGIQDPRNPDKMLGSLALDNWDTMETSGDYQRYIEVNGIRYSHILDPKTGSQPRTVKAVTVICNNSLDGDIFSTALFILGVDEGKKLLKQFPGVEAVFSTTDGKTILTDGLKNKMKID
ncbi:MAG: FAD:protein FMN transferase [Negativicutes bacterium]|jgi:thiamine biosynthesis lipoprotein